MDAFGKSLSSTFRGQPQLADFAALYNFIYFARSLASSTSAPAHQACDVPSRTSRGPEEWAHRQVHGGLVHAASQKCNFDTILSALTGVAVAGFAASGLGAACDSGEAAGAAELVHQLWIDAVDEIERQDSQLNVDNRGCPMREPEYEAGAVTDVITFHVRDRVDCGLLERALCQLSPLQESWAPFAGSRVQIGESRISVRDDSGGRQVSVHQGARRVELHVPRRGAGRDGQEGQEGQPRPVVRLVRDGHVQNSDLPLIHHLMLLTNDLRLRAKVQRGGSFLLGSDEELPGFPGRPGLFGGPAAFADDLLNAMMELMEAHQESMGLERADSLGRGADAPDGHSGTVRGGGAPVAPTDAALSEAERQQQRNAPLVRKLEELGAVVHLPAGEGEGTLDWGSMAGYEEQKALVEDLVLMSITHAAEYAAVAQKTRKDGKCQRPKAVLFEGPPGTGKTTAARIIASQAAIPLVYIPLESVASKWYGEGERLLSTMLKTAEAMGGCIIFLDEVDSLAGKRTDDMHESTRRLLGVLLRFVDGFQATDSIIVAATNRKQDLDAAMLSRCDAVVRFDLPGRDCRADILGLYAAHLSHKELQRIAEVTEGMSARDLRSICEVAERRWVSAAIRGQEPPGSLPPVDAYLRSAAARRASLDNIAPDNVNAIQRLAQSVYQR